MSVGVAATPRFNSPKMATRSSAYQPGSPASRSAERAASAGMSTKPTGRPVISVSIPAMSGYPIAAGPVSTYRSARCCGSVRTVAAAAATSAGSVIAMRAFPTGANICPAWRTWSAAANRLVMKNVAASTVDGTATVRR